MIEEELLDVLWVWVEDGCDSPGVVHPLCIVKLAILSAKELFLWFLQLMWFSRLERMDERVL